MRKYSNQEIDQISAALDGVIAAIEMTLGPCRFESATFRSSGLVVPAIRGAVERLVGGSLLRGQLVRRHDGVLFGALNERTITMLRMTAMLKAWPAFLKEWRLTGWPGECWLTFHRAGEPRPVERPPRIDHIVRISLGHDWFPLYGPWLLPDGSRTPDLRGGRDQRHDRGQTIH